MNSSGLAPSSSPSGLFADLYEFTMAQAFFQQGMTGQATFSLFVRHLPPNRGFLVNAGLQDALDFLETLAFQSADLDFLRSTGIFDGGFLEYLKGFRFTGRVRALPEGRVFFANEPVLEVTAPIIEAQIAETYIINQLNFQTLLATKAARCVHAAQGRVLADFAARRTHGSDAGLKMARCGYIAGFQSTSNVQAAQRYAIPPSGTMAHSFISSFESEEEAFRQYANSFPDRAVLLLDTYDTIQGARHAVTVGRELESRGHRLTAVRLDSGDFLDLSQRVRRILDDAGLGYVKIIASGGLDEYAIEELCAANAPIDIFGVGTKVGVSADAPWTDMAYKLVGYDGRPVMKLSAGKASLPGPKQVFRFGTSDGKFSQDVIGCESESLPGAQPLLEPVMAGGVRLFPGPPLDEARRRLAEDLQALDISHQAIEDPAPFPVAISQDLQDLTQRVQSKIANV